MAELIWTEPALHEPKGRASSPLRADGCNQAFLQPKERRARSDAPYLAQSVHGPDARPIWEVEALDERRLPNKSLCFTGFFINLDL